MADAAPAMRPLALHGLRGQARAMRRQIDRAFQLAFTRSPDATEARAAEAVVREHGLPTLCRVIFNANELLFIP